MAEAENIDVVEKRKDFLEELRVRVDKAFENRIKETYEATIKSTPEGIERQKGIRNMFKDLDDDEHIFIGANLDKPHQVSVFHSHDYKDLLKMTLDKLVVEGCIDSNKVDSIIQESLEHEFSHSVPGLDQDFLNIQYGVGFMEDTKKDFIGIQPFVGFSGLMRVSIYKDTISNVSNPSPGDKEHYDKK